MNPTAGILAGIFPFCIALSSLRLERYEASACYPAAQARQHSYPRDFRVVLFDCFFFDRRFGVFLVDFLAVFETVFFALFARFVAPFFALFAGVFAAWATAFVAFFTGAGIRLATAFLARFATALTAVSASVPAA